MTEREIEVMKRAADGMTTRETAEALQISTEEVKRCLQGVYEKLGVHARPQPPPPRSA